MLFRSWKIYDKIDNKTYEIAATWPRMAIFERSEYFDSDNIFEFPSILSNGKDFNFTEYFDNKTNVSAKIRQSSLINCLGQQINLLKEGYSVVECGAGPTQSSLYISRLLSRISYAGDYFVYDTFEGHPSYDTCENYKAKEHIYSHEKFCQSFGTLPFIRIVKGKVPDSFKIACPTEICFISLDKIGRASCRERV